MTLTTIFPIFLSFPRKASAELLCVDICYGRFLR